MTRIYFRTDGNNKIATGHLMRCLAIARACAQKNADVKFIVSDQESLTLLQDRFAVPQEFDIYCLHCDYTKPEQEIPTLFSWLDSGRNDRPNISRTKNKPWIFIDSYYVTTLYFQTLRKYFRVAYLDDLRSFDCPVDLVINYDTDESCAFYTPASRRLLGVQYTPLREQFRAPSYEVRPTVRNILLSTGGTDPYKVAESLLEMIYDDVTALRSMHYHILTSRANTRYDALCTLAQEHPTIHIHTNVTEVAALMASCDLAVSAGGTTLCELCCVGVPSISYLMADNQSIAVETYAQRNLIPCAGDIRPGCPSALLPSALTPSDSSTIVHMSDRDQSDIHAPNPSVLCRILAFLSNMSQDHNTRAAVSSAMRDFLDGTGAEKIAQELLTCGNVD